MQENYSLKNYNTFGIDVYARYFDRFSSLQDLEALQSKASGQPLLILGGGSNILFTGNYDGMVLKNEISGIRQVGQDNDYAYVQAGRGRTGMAL